MLLGGLIIAIGTALAIIGVFSDTQKRPYLKFLLLALILASGAAGLMQEHSQDRDQKSDRASVATEREAARRAREEAAESRAEFDQFKKTNQQQLAELIDTVTACVNRVDEMEKAAETEGNQKIARMSRAAKLESSKALVNLVEKRQLMPPAQLKKMKAGLRSSKALSNSDLESIRSNIMKPQ